MLYLNLSFNRLTGPVPTSIGEKLSLVQVIDMSNNNITGHVPDSISKLGILWILNLSYNDLSGLVPYSGGCKNLNITAFMGNPGLCGKCFGLTETSVNKQEEEEDNSNIDFLWCFALDFYLGFSNKEHPRPYPIQHRIR